MAELPGGKKPAKRRPNALRTSEKLARRHPNLTENQIEALSRTRPQCEELYRQAAMTDDPQAHIKIFSELHQIASQSGAKIFEYLAARCLNSSGNTPKMQDALMAFKIRRYQANQAKNAPKKTGRQRTATLREREQERIDALTILNGMNVPKSQYTSERIALTRAWEKGPEELALFLHGLTGFHNFNISQSQFPQERAILANALEQGRESTEDYLAGLSRRFNPKPRTKT